MLTINKIKNYSTIFKKIINIRKGKLRNDEILYLKLLVYSSILFNKK